MTEETSSRMHCCNAQMLQLAMAERRGGGDRVTVYRCETCGRIDPLGVACTPLVGRSHGAQLRAEAFHRAGLEADPAAAIPDSANRGDSAEQAG